MALSWAIGFYIYHFGATKIARFYGAMATPITLAIWLQWGALGMLIGAEVNLSLQSLRSKNELERAKPSSAA
jgi:uncharacterized BrkB/YihY/UPF0761 family membrane protein